MIITIYLICFICGWAEFPALRLFSMRAEVIILPLLTPISLRSIIRGAANPNVSAIRLILLLHHDGYEILPNIIRSIPFFFEVSLP